MKKILLFIIMFFITFKVSAKTYYSDYGQYSEYQDNIIEASDVIEVEKTSIYELYKENIEYVYLEDSIYEETGNTKKVETSWVEDIELLDSNKEIESYYSYLFYLAKEYKYFVLRNDSNRMLMIDNFKLYNKVEDKYIFISPQIILYPNDKFVIELGTENNLTTTEVEVMLSGYDDSTEKVKFSVLAYEDYPTLVNGDLIETVIGTSKSASLIITDFSIYSNLYLMHKEMVGCILDRLIENLGEYKAFYRNVYELKEYKVITKIYTGEYAFTNKDEYLIDLERIKYQYRYRKREKVVIDDELIIDNYDQQLTDFIEYTSIDIDDIKITSDVNYKVNGKYTINFILPYETITKDIEVDIKDNYINLINEQAKYINELQQTTKEAVYFVDKKNLEIKEVIVEEETKVIELNESLNNCLKDIKTLKEQKENITEEKKIKEQSIGYIYVVLVMIIFLALYRYRYLKKND